jgi:hypothetical protein
MMKKDFFSLWRINKQLFLIACLLVISLSSSALPFNIVPKAGTTLPTVVNSGSVVPAYYTVTNNTSSQRNGNYVKYLPLNVTQVTTGGTYGDTCGTTFNLAARGQAGDSCTLQLAVAGAVDGRDSNPHHHLFVCFPGGTTCAGTNYPLNVALVPLSDLTAITIAPVFSSVSVGGTQQYTAIGTYASGPTQNITNSVAWNSSNPSVATINATGLATGVSAGSTVITATLASIISNSATLTVSNLIGGFAYVTNLGNNTVSDCSIDVNTSLFSSCNSDANAFGFPTAVLVNTTKTAAYVTNGTPTRAVAYCPINLTTGAFNACTDAAPTSPNLDQPFSMVMNVTGTHLYAVNANGVVSFCDVNQTDGTLNNCADTGAVLSAPRGITLNQANTIAYITDNNNLVYACNIVADGTLSSCTSTGSAFNSPFGIALNPANTFAYITNQTSSNMTICAVNGAVLSSCTVVGSFSTPANIAINAAGTFLYVTNQGNNTVSACVINNDGSLGVCTATGTGLNNPAGIALL